METTAPPNVRKHGRVAAVYDDRTDTPDAIRISQATAVAIAPVVMLAGLLYHPHLGNPTDDAFLANLASAVIADPMRWGIAHLLVAIGSGLVLLAFLAIRSHLRTAGEERWSVVGLPFIVMGSVLYALLPAMEFVPLAAANSGNDVQAAQAALYPWFIPTLFSSAILFLLGTVAFTFGIIRSQILSPRLAWIVAGFLVLMAAARLVPLGLVQMQVQAFAGVLALWPLAYAVWKGHRAKL